MIFLKIFTTELDVLQTEQKAGVIVKSRLYFSLSTGFIANIVVDIKV